MKKKYRIIAIVLVAVMILIEGFTLVIANALEYLELDKKWWEMSTDVPYTDTFHYDGSVNNYKFQENGRGFKYFAGMTGIHTYYISPDFEDGTFYSQHEMLEAMSKVLNSAMEDASKYEKYLIYIPTQRFGKHSYDEPGYDRLDPDERYISFEYDCQVYHFGLDFREQAIVTDVCSERLEYNLKEFVQYMKVGPDKFANHEYDNSREDPIILGANAIYYNMDINHWNIIRQFVSYKPERVVNQLFEPTELAKYFGLSEEEFLDKQAKIIKERNSADIGDILVDISAGLIFMGFPIGIVIFIIYKVVEVYNKRRRENVEIEHRKADLRKKNVEIDRMEADNVARILNAPLKRADSVDKDFEAEYDNKKITRKVVEANKTDKDKILNWYKDISYNGFNTNKYTREAMELLLDVTLENNLIDETEYLSRVDDFAEWLTLQEEE